MHLEAVEIVSSDVSEALVGLDTIFWYDDQVICQFVPQRHRKIGVSYIQADIDDSKIFFARHLQQAEDIFWPGKGVSES